MMSTWQSALGLSVALASTGCLPTYEPTPAASVVPEDNSNAGPTEANTTVSNAAPALRPTTPSQATPVWLAHGDPSLANAAAPASLSVTATEHACMKMRYDTLGRILKGRGVTMPTLPVTLAMVTATSGTGSCASLITAGSNPSLLSEPAAYVYCTGALTLGLPLATITPEVAAPTTASATKMMDVALAAAPEFIKNMGAMAACLDANNQPAVLFNADNSCNESGLTCLQGYPATPAQVALCTQLVAQAVPIPSSTTPATTGVSATIAGQRLAVAAVFSAAHVCE